MSRKQFALLVFAAGVVVLLSAWGRVSDLAESLVRGEAAVRHKKVVYWTPSGSPEVDLKRARNFEQRYPDIRIQPNFRASGGLNDILFISFLSGNPPDYMAAQFSELRKYVLMGGIRPFDDLLAMEEARHRREGMDYYAESLLGRARVHRFRASPDDRYLREMEKHPVEAARLLHMHGKAIGFRDASMPNTLTYNKRLFREAARMFPDRNLVDARGEPIPPTTWIELYDKAKVITEYGRRAAQERGLREPVCYGVVLQGQKIADMLRSIAPLANRAGSMNFNFAGDTDRVHQYFDDSPLGQQAKERFAGKPIGYFEYDNDAYLASLGLVIRLKQDGLVLPGTESREYEAVRTILASGKAAMLFEGWHAALIGAERVPWAAQDLGSAVVPRPLPELDAAAGITAERVERERVRLNELLGLDKAGLTVTSGGKVPRIAGGQLQFMTSLCRHPDATWEWMHFAVRDDALLKAECRRGIPHPSRRAMAHRGDSEWFPYPYQEQIFQIMEKDCQMWPEAPVHGTVGKATQNEIFYKYFYQQDLTDLPTILRKVREEVRRFSDAANRDLAKRIEDGMTRPIDWTFPDWDPRSAERFFTRQQERGPTDADAPALEEAKRRLVELAKARPDLRLLDESGGLRADVWKFRNPDSPWQALYIPALMGAVVLGWLLYMALRDRRARRPMLAEVGRQARQNWHGYLFVMPGMIAIFAFAIYPSLYQIWLAMHSGDGLETMQYVGWDNFRRILDPSARDFDRVFWNKVLPNSLIYMVIVTAGHIILGMMFASLLNMPLRANRFYRVLYFIPLVTSLAVVSVIMVGLLRGPDSGVNQFLKVLGLGDLPHWMGLVPKPGMAHDWLGTKTGLFSVMGVAIWHGLPYTIILLLAGLQSISPDLYEAAKVDGAGAWKRFRHVTIPEIMPILVIIIFNSFIGAARALGSVLVLTEGGVDHSSEVVALYIFKWGFMRPEGQEANLGYASALGIVYSAMLAGLTVTNVTIVARRWKRRLAMERVANAPVAVPQGGAA